MWVRVLPYIEINQFEMERQQNETLKFHSERKKRCIHNFGFCTRCDWKSPSKHDSEFDRTHRNEYATNVNINFVSADHFDGLQP